MTLIPFVELERMPFMRALVGQRCSFLRWQDGIIRASCPREADAPLLVELADGEAIWWYCSEHAKIRAPEIAGLDKIRNVTFIPVGLALLKEG